MQLCSGPRDEERYKGLSAAERGYGAFFLEWCGRILSRRPQQEDALAAAANHLTAMGYYAAGLALDRQLVALRPRDSGAVYNLACSLALVGKREEALAVLEQAIAFGYDNAAHMAHDEDLANLRDDPRFLELVRRANDAQSHCSDG